MKVLDQEISPLGMGCWPIGGPFFAGDKPLGWANVEDAESRRTIHAAYDAGIRLFDTAAVYGAGHAERLLGEELADKPDALIVSKIGMGFDEVTKQVTGDETDPETVMPAIDRCLRRLERDRIDVLLLHQNALPVTEAAPIFEQMEIARQSGKIRAYGWSTDFPDRAAAMAGQAGFGFVEHAMNVFIDVPAMQGTVHDHDLTALIRSPLAMGVLTGKYDATSRMAADDNRAANDEWRDYYQDGAVRPDFLDHLAAVREVLQTGGRTLTQGALCWLMAKSERNLPVPGARTVKQITDSAGAIAKGPLPAAAMAEIERLIARTPEGPPRKR